MLRILRSLRIISHNHNIKLIVVALIQSLGPLINVFGFVCLIFLIFAIMGMNLLQGKMGYCSSLDNYYGVNKIQVFFI